MGSRSALHSTAPSWAICVLKCPAVRCLRDRKAERLSQVPSAWGKTSLCRGQSNPCLGHWMRPAEMLWAAADW